MGACMIEGNHLTLWGRVWCEPMTVATDGLLVLLCAALAARHRGAARGFFLLTAAAFGLGGLRHLVYAEWHGLVPPLSQASNTASSLALTALVFALPSPRPARAAAGILAAAMIAGHLLIDHIALSIVHTAVVFLGILGGAVVARQLRAYRWFVVAFGLSLAAAAVFALRLTPAFWFNHNDLAHVALMGAYSALSAQLVLVSRGGRR